MDKQTTSEGMKLLEEIFQKAVEALPPDFMDKFTRAREPETIHWSELPPSRPGYESADYETYRREVGRYLAEGHAGQWVLIQGGKAIGFWPTEVEVTAEGYRRFPGHRFYVHQILERERIYRTGYYRLCS
jgi:hypothetical protein